MLGVSGWPRMGAATGAAVEGTVCGMITAGRQSLVCGSVRAADACPIVLQLEFQQE